MTLGKLFLLKAIGTFCFAVSTVQGAFDPFAIYQGSPVPSFPRNSEIALRPKFRSYEQPSKDTNTFGEDPFFKPEGLQPYSSNFFLGNSKKSTSSLPKDERDDYREKFRSENFGHSSRPPRPQYLDSRPNRHHYSRPKDGRRPSENNRDKMSVPQASRDTPMIFSFRLNRKFWDDKLKRRVSSLENLDFVDEMEGYAKPSMQIGYRLMEWFRGLRGSNSKGDPVLVTQSSATATASAKSSEKSDSDKLDPPVYYSHSQSSTEIIRGGSGKRGVPPVAFSANSDYDHSIEHYRNNHAGGIYNDDSKGSEIPLGNILKANAGKGKANFNPRCNKGGSMIFCNSDALMGLLDLLEEHMQKSGKPFDNHNQNQNNQYKSNLKFPGEGPQQYRQPMKIEVIEMDPALNAGGKTKTSNDFNQLHDIEHFNPKTNDDSSHGSSGYGFEDPSRDIEVVIVVHTKGGAFGKSTHPSYGHPGHNPHSHTGHDPQSHAGRNPHSHAGHDPHSHAGHGPHSHNEFGHYGGNYGSGYKNTHDMYRKPYKHFDDDEDQNNYDRKFDRLKKILDIVRQRNNKVAGGWHNDDQYRGNEYGQGQRHKGDDYWNSLLGEYKFGNYIPLTQNTKDGPSQVHQPHVEEDPNNFDGGLYIDMKDNEQHSYGRERNPDRRGRVGEQFFGQARAGKSKHATKRERDGAIRSKIEQVYFRH